MSANRDRDVNGDAARTISTVTTTPTAGTPMPTAIPQPTGGAPGPRRPARPRTAVRRLPDKQVRDRGQLDALLDRALVGHVAVLDDAGGQPRPYVIPVAFARDHDQVLVHGSTASRAFRALAAGQPTCLTVTVVDGIIVARSQFESSMRYRSGMVLGTFEVLHGTAKLAGLERLAARLLPGLDGPRRPSAQELTATAVLALPLEEWSLKVSAGHPEDAAEDLDRPVWAGTVPLHHQWGAPIPAPGLAPDLAVPPAIAAWVQGQA